jgi:hypothetical protein
MVWPDAAQDSLASEICLVFEGDSTMTLVDRGKYDDFKKEASFDLVHFDDKPNGSHRAMRIPSLRRFRDVLEAVNGLLARCLDSALRNGVF